MHILVLGASGGVGQQLVKQGSERGHQIRAVVRDGTAFEGPPGVEVVRGDVLDRSLLIAALQGTEGVLSSLGIRRRSKNPWSALTSPPDFCSRSAQVLVEAMQAASVARVVAVSAAGVAESEAKMNFIMRWLVSTSNIGVAYRDLAVMERIYAESGLDWCCARPVALTDGPRTDRVRPVEHFGLTGFISRADVAAWMLDRLERGGEERLVQISG